MAINLASALSLYWMAGGLIAIWQQSRILKKDVTEMEAEVDGEPVEAEIIESTNTTKKPKNKTKKSKKTKKRRK